MISSAWAHHVMEGALPRTFIEGLLSGLGHPLIGVDHFAFIFAAGFLLALVARGLWGVAALIVGTLIGAAIHLQGNDLPYGEIGVALSVILIGALVAWRHPLPLGWLSAGLLLAGILHGNAYAESIFGAQPAPLYAYLFGFSLIQLAVAAAAFLLHKKYFLNNRKISPALGSLAAAVGVAFLFL